MTRLRIAQVGPVATTIPPQRSSSVELVTAILVDALSARGHDVTLFATRGSRTAGRLVVTFERGYAEDPSMWPWELCELMNLAAAVERASEFDVIHYQAMYTPLSVALTKVAGVPVVQTVHHAPTAQETALWQIYRDAPFVAISKAQARILEGLNVVGTVHHGLDVRRFAFSADPGDYLLFLGRFTEGKGVRDAIDVARQCGVRLLLAAAENDYYHTAIAPLVDGERVVYLGELDHDEKVRVLGGARALLYPVQTGEPFGLVLIEAMLCGTPVVALDRGASAELVEQGVTGYVVATVAEMVSAVPAAMALDRAVVRASAAERYTADNMAAGYEAAYLRVLGNVR